ncbi:SAP49_2 [Sanghuangporus sanghuang]
MSRQDDRNQEATVYLGNLDERVTDAIIWELMLQAGPVVNVHLPKDRISMAHQGYGFCEFLTEEDAEYACKIMNQIKLWGKPIRVNKASSDKKQLDVGANLFVGNLDENVDERLLYDTFSAFGMLATTAKVARDPTTGKSKGYGFVSYIDFESADAAAEAMNGQFLMNKAITVQYAFKKDGKGERHGTPAERLLAAQARKNNALPVSARPPPATLNALAAFASPATTPASAAPGHPASNAPSYGAPGPYQGQFAGALAAAPAPSPSPGMGMGVPPPAGFGAMSSGMPMGMSGMPTPPPGFAAYNAPAGMNMGMHPPPPPGFGAPPQGMGMPQPPPGFGAPQQGMPMNMTPPPR